MPKGKKGGGGRGVIANELLMSDYDDHPTSYVRHDQRTYRPFRHYVDPVLLKRAYMLQNFQFILRSDLLSAKVAHGLPQGQRKLWESLRSSDAMVPWEAVHSVVMHTTMDEFQCPICMEEPIAPRITECGHVFCLPCVLQYVHMQKKYEKPRICPVCHSTLLLITLRPCVLHPIQRLTAGMTVRFDLFKRERDSCEVHRYDDPRLTQLSRSSEVQQELRIPSYGEPCASQCRYVIATTDYEANQRYLDATSLSERLTEMEHQPRPLCEFDAAVMQFHLDALNEVTKESRGLSPSLAKESPPLVPRSSDGKEPAPLLELYAEGEGQPFYLHMISVKMLKHDAKLRQRPLPDSVLAPVVEITSLTQTEESRRIYKVFSHVPLHGAIRLCVLDLTDVVLPETLAAFKESLDNMARRRHEREAAADAAAEEDDSWKRYLQKYHSNLSPDPAPSDFSTEAETVSLFQLPSVTESAYSDHGLPPNPLDTRQRATKREVEPLQSDPPLASGTATTTASSAPTPLAGSGGSLPPQSAAGAAASSSTVDPAASPVSVGGGSCWSRGSAARLFASGGGRAATGPTWGGHTFQDHSGGGSAHSTPPQAPRPPKP